MSYSYSQIDRRNQVWFKNDIEAKSLMDLELRVGTLRGLHPCKIHMEYPISVIAGKNGSGKSTLLAMACCAFHNKKTGYVPADRRKTYYTFSDFFIQTADEVKVEGVQIIYGCNGTWINRAEKRRWEGLGYYAKNKKKGGKWDKYDKRPLRNVVFLGIQRIVPPSERKTERTYSGRFTSTQVAKDTKKEILEIASRVMGKTYTSLDLRTVDKRRLFVVDRKDKHYSGFNMGAGENAVFSLLIELFSAGRNSLLVVDEIELGLHEEAQTRLIEELKKVCCKLHCQIICSTHSARIIDALPPEGRFFVDSRENRTEIYTGISSAYAMGRLNGGQSREIVVFTEDEVGASVVESFLPQKIRERIRIIPIGSDQAVLKQLAARYRENGDNCIAFLDGDKRENDETARKQVKKYLEGRVEKDFESWLLKRLFYLPGDEWPEKYLVSLAENEALVELAGLWQIDRDALEGIFDEAIAAGKHNEFYTLQEKLVQKVDVIRNDVVREVSSKATQDFAELENAIRRLLDEQ